MFKPNINSLLFKAPPPTVCLTPKEIDLFECDPHEFMHHKNYMLANFYSPMMTSITLITDLIKHCGKDTIKGLLGFLTDIMSCYDCSDWVLSLNTSSL